MALIKKTYTAEIDAIWRGECKIYPAGFKLNDTLPVGSVVRRGTPVYVEFDANRKAYICKSAEVLDGADADALKVKKGHFFAVGDKVTTAGDSTASATPKTISAIDKSNAEYDVITLNNDITGLSSNKGTIVEAGGTTNAYLGKSKYEPNAVVGANLEVSELCDPVVDAAFNAVVLTPSLNFPIPSIWVEGGASMKGNHEIKFITQ